MKAMKSLIACSMLVAVAYASGCNSDAPQSSAPGPVTFATEAPPEGASVYLREQPNLLAPNPNRVVVDVVARGAANLHGVAFRVTWDPEALGFVEATSGAPWSKTMLSLAKEGSPGQLAVAWTEKGETSIDATGETVIGTLVFDARSRKGTALAFKPERSQLVDKKGARVIVAWRGGNIPAR